MSSRCWQAEALPAAAALSVRQLITAAESGNSSSSKAVRGSPGPDTELPDRYCSWSRQQPERSVDRLLHHTSQTTPPPSPTPSPRLRSAASQHLRTLSGMSEFDRGAPLPSLGTPLGTPRNDAQRWGGMDNGPANATFQGREPARESMLPEGTALGWLELCNKVSFPHCLVSSAKCLKGLRVHAKCLRGVKVHLWTPGAVHVRFSGADAWRTTVTNEEGYLTSKASDTFLLSAWAAFWSVGRQSPARVLLCPLDHCRGQKPFALALVWCKRPSAPTMRPHVTAVPTYMQSCSPLCLTTSAGCPRPHTLHHCPDDAGICCAGSAAQQDS